MLQLSRYHMSASSTKTIMCITIYLFLKGGGGGDRKKKKKKKEKKERKKSKQTKTIITVRIADCCIMHAGT